MRIPAATESETYERNDFLQSRLKTRKQRAGVMSTFVHLLRTPDARYAIGAVVSWPIYGALYIAMLEVFDRHYAAAAGISWILSYGVVYAFQKYGTFGAMSREAMLRESGTMLSPWSV